MGGKYQKLALDLADIAPAYILKIGKANDQKQDN